MGHFAGREGGCPKCRQVAKALADYFSDPEQHYPYDLIRLIEAGPEPARPADLWKLVGWAEGGCQVGEGGAG